SARDESCRTQCAPPLPTTNDPLADEALGLSLRTTGPRRENARSCAAADRHIATRADRNDATDRDDGDNGDDGDGWWSPAALGGGFAAGGGGAPLNPSPALRIEEVHAR